MTNLGPAMPGIILMYHRLAEHQVDPWALSVTPAHFAEQMELVIGMARPIRLGELWTGGNGPPKEPWVAVTLDDGYATTLAAAQPLLEELDVPATAFVVTEALSPDHGAFWWDELELLVYQDLPSDELVLEVAGEAHRWKPQPDRDDTEQRLMLLRFLHGILQHLAEPARHRALEAIAQWFGGRSRVPAAMQPVSADEVLRLDRSSPIEMASHSASHPFLPFLDREDQRRELEESRQALEALLERPVDLFSYPFGGWDPAIRDLVRAARYRLACTVDQGAVDATTDPLELPRIQVGDWDGDELARCIRPHLVS